VLSFYWVYQDATTGDFYLILHTSILNLLTNLYQLLLVSVAYSVSSKCSYKSLPFLCWIYLLFVFPFFFFWIHEGLVTCCNVHFSLEGRFSLVKCENLVLYEMHFLLRIICLLKNSMYPQKHVLAYFVAQPWAMQ
jgi:hypothetical protein